ncbi:MAG: PASTA domain-containing protein [Acidobacteriota bacterium]
MTKGSDRLAAMSSQKARPHSIIWTIARRLAMVIVLVLAFLLSATVTIYVLFRSGDTRVPNVVGKPEAEARKMAEDAGLKVKIQLRSDDKIPASTVIETRPGPNSSVKKDSTLTIYVSSGPAATRSHLFNLFSVGGSPLKGLL